MEKEASKTESDVKRFFSISDSDQGNTIKSETSSSKLFMLFFTAEMQYFHRFIFLINTQFSKCVWVGGGVMTILGKCPF